MNDDTQQEITDTADEIAKAIVREYVLAKTDHLPDGMVVDRSIKPNLAAKMALYKVAIVLMVLLAEEENNPDLLSVRVAIEAIFHLDQPEGQDRLRAVKVAMEKLNSLILSQDRREFTWSRSWLEELGVEETNPARLALFAMHWFDHYVMVTKIIRGCKILDAPKGHDG